MDCSWKLASSFFFLSREEKFAIRDFQRVVNLVLFGFFSESLISIRRENCSDRILWSITIVQAGLIRPSLASSSH